MEGVCSMNCVAVPVVTAAIGTATKGVKINVEAAQAKRSAVSLQKTAILGTSHIIRKVLQCEA